MADYMKMFVKVSGNVATIFVGLLVAGGVALNAPLVGFFPAWLHTILGYAISVGGVITLFQK